MRSLQDSLSCLAMPCNSLLIFVCCSRVIHVPFGAAKDSLKDFWILQDSYTTRKILLRHTRILMECYPYPWNVLYYKPVSPQRIA